MSKHTPSELWLFVDDHHSTRVVIDGVGISAPYRQEPGTGRCERQDADNKLIAAAPDMLAALNHVEAVLSLVEPRSDKREYLETLDEVRAVIAKAVSP